jgi:hypothetical protein
MYETQQSLPMRIVLCFERARQESDPIKLLALIHETEKALL